MPGRTGITISYCCSSNLSTSCTSVSRLVVQKSIAAVELMKSIACELLGIQEPTSLKYKPVSFCWRSMRITCVLPLHFEPPPAHCQANGCYSQDPGNVKVTVTQIRPEAM